MTQPPAREACEQETTVTPTTETVGGHDDARENRVCLLQAGQREAPAQHAQGDAVLQPLVQGLPLSDVREDSQAEQPCKVLPGIAARESSELPTIELLCIEHGRDGGDAHLEAVVDSLADAEAYVAEQYPKAVRDPNSRAFWTWTEGVKGNTGRWVRVGRWPVKYWRLTQFHPGEELRAERDEAQKNWPPSFPDGPGALSIESNPTSSQAQQATPELLIEPHCREEICVHCGAPAVIKFSGPDAIFPGGNRGHPNTWYLCRRHHDSTVRELHRTLATAQARVEKLERECARLKSLNYALHDDDIAGLHNRATTTEQQAAEYREQVAALVAELRREADMPMGPTDDKDYYDGRDAGLRDAADRLAALTEKPA